MCQKNIIINQYKLKYYTILINMRVAVQCDVVTNTTQKWRANVIIETITLPLLHSMILQEVL